MFILCIFYYYYYYYYRCVLNVFYQDITVAGRWFGELSVTVCVMFLQEGVPSHNENMQYVNLAMQAFQKGLCHSELIQDPRDANPVKRDSRGQIRKNSSDLVRGSVPFSVPFGPHLTPVRCQQEYSPETRSVTTKDLEVSSDTERRTNLACAVHQGKYKCSPALTQSRPCDCADGTPENSSEDCMEPEHRAITTNDLLDCLVHPDVIARVTRLLLERHRKSKDRHTTLTY